MIPDQIILIRCSPTKATHKINNTYYWSYNCQLAAFSRIIDFLHDFLGPPGRAVGQDPPGTELDLGGQILEEPAKTPGVEQLRLMSFLKVDQTLMQRRGNWSKGILNYLMRGKLIWTVSFSPLFYPAGSHGRSLHNKRATWPGPASLKTPSWTKETLGMCESKFWSEGDPCFTLRTATHFPEILCHKDFRPEHIGTFMGPVPAVSVQLIHDYKF